jgi:hypothetical protein
MIKSLIVSGALLAASMLGSGGAMAKEWVFYVENKSNHAVIEFRTREDGEWSKNWISDRIEPNAKFEMDFGTSEGDCTIRTQITFTDGSKFDANVDYCKVTTLYLYEDKLRWD